MRSSANTYRYHRPNYLKNTPVKVPVKTACLTVSVFIEHISVTELLFINTQWPKFWEWNSC